MSPILRLIAEPRFQIWVMLFIAVAIGECLVAIWAATSRRHWFWRMLAVWAAVMLMVPIRAWEPAWLFALSSPLLVGALLLARHRLHWSLTPPGAESELTPRYRFSLRDLFLLVLAVGLWLPGLLEIGRNFRPQNWLGWLFCALGLVALALVACA